MPMVSDSERELKSYTSQHTSLAVLYRQTLLTIDDIHGISIMDIISAVVKLEVANVPAVDESLYLRRLRSSAFCPFLHLRLRSWRASVLEYTYVLQREDSTNEFRH
jgi:hypothetical protein